MPSNNGPVHVQYSIMRNVMTSATEAALGRLFENFQKATSMRTALAEMDHQQPPTPVATYNKSANSIVNGTENQKISRAIDMTSYWVRDRIRQNHFRIFWEEGKKNLTDYVTKHHSIWQQRAMRPRYVKETKKDIENSKYRRIGTRRGCAGTTNPSITRKPDNNLKGIRDLVQKGTQIQWPRRLIFQT